MAGLFTEEREERKAISRPKNFGSGLTLCGLCDLGAKGVCLGWLAAWFIA
jgi:hypothetical protein